MNGIVKVALRMTLVTVTVGSIAGAYVLGYHVGWRECLRDWSYQPAVVVKTTE